MHGLYLVLGYDDAGDVHFTDQCQATWVLDWDARTAEGVYQHCVASEPLTLIEVGCRCGDRATFRVCPEDLDAVEAGIAHQAPWCVYCFEPVATHQALDASSLSSIGTSVTP